MGRGDAGDDALHRVAHLLRGARAKRAHGAAEPRRAGDDVPGRAGVERRHRDDDRVERVGLAGDDLLQVRDHLRGDRDRVDGLVRVRAVAAVAEDLEREQVGGGHDRARRRRDVPVSRLESRCTPATRSAPSRTPASMSARGAAGRQLLGVLEDEAHLAGELVAALDEELRGAEQHRRMAVVSARVHDAGPRRDVRDVVLLQDRERVHVGAEHDDLARAARRATARRPPSRPVARARDRRTSAASARRTRPSRAPRTRARGARAGAAATRSRVPRDRRRRVVGSVPWSPRGTTLPGPRRSRPVGSRPWPTRQRWTRSSRSASGAASFSRRRRSTAGSARHTTTATTACSSRTTSSSAGWRRWCRSGTTSWRSTRRSSCTPRCGRHPATSAGSPTR